MARATTKTANQEPTLEQLQEELAAAKRKLREQRMTTVQVAQKYAAQHNLCSVVDQALTEAGLLGGSVSKKVSMLIPVEVVMGIDGDLVENMTEEEIKQAIAEMAKPTSVNWGGSIGPVTSVANGRVRRTEPVSTFGEVQVLSVEDPPSLTTVSNDNGWSNPPNGHVALYTAPEGRKLHFVTAVETSHHRAVAVEINGMTFYTVRTPLCGASVSYYGAPWAIDSPRKVSVGTRDGICQGCRDLAQTRYGWRLGR
jgi:hypothetical protein